MKITRFILVFLILASLLLAGCTDRKAKPSDSTADLPKPTISSGTPDSSQPGPQESPGPETDSRTSEPTEADASIPPDPAETTEDQETAAATTENTSGTDPVETVITDDSGVPVEEDATIIASGGVEFIGGD